MFTTTRQQIANARDGLAYRVVRDGVGPAALLFLIVVGFFWKITLTSQFTWLESPDLANQVLPWQQVQAAAFHSGQFPAWAWIAADFPYLQRTHLAQGARVS